jgi:hypothetical protein
LTTTAEIKKIGLYNGLLQQRCDELQHHNLDQEGLITMLRDDILRLKEELTKLRAVADYWSTQWKVDTEKKACGEPIVVPLLPSTEASEFAKEAELDKVWRKQGNDYWTKFTYVCSKMLKHCAASRDTEMKIFDDFGPYGSWVDIMNKVIEWGHGTVKTFSYVRVSDKYAHAEWEWRFTMFTVEQSREKPLPAPIFVPVNSS